MSRRLIALSFSSHTSPFRRRSAAPSSTRSHGISSGASSLTAWVFVTTTGFAAQAVRQRLSSPVTNRLAVALEVFKVLLRLFRFVLAGLEALCQVGLVFGIALCFSAQGGDGGLALLRGMEGRRDAGLP